MAGIAPQKSGPVPQELELPGGKSGFRNWLDRKAWRDIIIAVPYVWLLLFFVVPFFIIVAMSLAYSVIAQPPFGYDETWPYVTFENFTRLFSDYVYLRGYLTSLRNALLATALCLLLGYPMALGIARAKGVWRNILLLLVILPFWTSFLLRVYAWIGMMGSNSWFNRGLTSLHQRVPARRFGNQFSSDDELKLRRHPRRGLFLPALHDPAALRQSGKT